MLDGYDGLPLARLCVTKLSTFLENTDQNREFVGKDEKCTDRSVIVKYIALMAMVKIVPVHPELVAEQQAVILASLDDFDISIRMRALELVSSMVTHLFSVYLRSNTSRRLHLEMPSFLFNSCYPTSLRQNKQPRSHLLPVRYQAH